MLAAGPADRQPVRRPRVPSRRKRMTAGQQEHQGTNEIQRIRGADGNVERAANGRTEQLPQVLSLVRPKHRMPSDRRKCLRAIAGL
jgi:hypothetical protein